MATLVLQTVGTVVGAALGGPMGAAIGGVIGTAAGSVIDQTLIGSVTRGGGGRKVSYGPRLKDLDGITATEGAPIPRLYGRSRLGGQVIWATRFEEQTTTTTTKPRGGKGGVGGKPKASTEVRYSYYANVAIALCEGPIAFVRRVWADGKLLDLTTITMRVHSGDDNQAADPLIAARQGADQVPAYRGTAYVVLEHFPLEDYGNRLPQLNFEVVRPVHGLCSKIRAVNLIPGAGEFVYEPGSNATSGAYGSSSIANRHQTTHVSNWAASIDALQALCPNLQHVALVVTWFGDDLRAGQCTLRPKIEPGSLDGYPHAWSVAGMTRGNAQTVSLVDGKAAFGGTPSDGSVIRAIRDLKARGLSVTLYPFIMMDVPAGNTLADPWTGAASQPQYPWRGRVTCDPAPGRPGSAEGALAVTQVLSFVGTAVASDFTVGTDTVTYTGPVEWSLRRMVLHAAALGKAAGGIDAIVIGSELIGLTRVRGTGVVNPAVAQLKKLAAEVRDLSGPQLKITYAADWTEYGSEARAGGDLRFPLDPLWADANINAVAIDWYPPVTDWRDGDAHADAALYDSPHDARMFSDRIMAGEAFDWYYADGMARAAQTRLPITDGAYGKPWVYRAKDIGNWWASPHHERTGGVESTTPTAWNPGSKPIWLMELGCPAVDRGGNGPNTFPDPKSVEGALPPFSRGGRDDLVQKRLLEATFAHFDPGAPGFVPLRNPLATAYAGRMLDLERIYLWAWDARPFPAFPDDGDAWGDAANYAEGHWLNGRLEGAPMDDLVLAVLADHNQSADVIAIDGFAEGYVIDRPMTVRAAVEPLADVFGFDGVFSGGRIAFKRRGGRASLALDADSLAVVNDTDRPLKTRRQASETPAALTLAYQDVDLDYRQGAVRVAIDDPSSQSDVTVEAAIGMTRAAARQRAEAMLTEIRQQREVIRFALPQSQLALEPGDVVTLNGRRNMIRQVTDGATRVIEAVAASRLPHRAAQRSGMRANPSPARFGGKPAVVVLDLPVADSSQPPLHYVAVAADPWHGPMTVWRSADGLSFDAVADIPARAAIGATLTALPPGQLWRSMSGQSFEIEVPNAALQSLDPVAALGGRNLIAVQNPDLSFEIVSFASAVLLSPGRWRLSHLVRGLAGSEGAASVLKPAGATVVILDDAVTSLTRDPADIGRPFQYRVTSSGRDYADPLAASFTSIAGTSSLLSLPPVHVRATRGPSEITLTWIRRTRFGGDNWEIHEVPLNEDTERYKIEIMSGGGVKRLAESTQPAWIYEAVQETADFGTPQTTLDIQIRQWSGIAGFGRAFRAIVPVR
jgi:GTA TIM-barrel-like domain/Putative phage tail protein